MNYLKSFINGFITGFKNFGHLISNIVNGALLFIVYFTVLGLTSIIGKLSNKKFLELAVDKNKKSFWSKRRLDKKTLEDYYRQF